MRSRFVLSFCAATAVLAVAATQSAYANGCSRVASARSYSGIVHMGFDAQASGPNEPGQPQYGIETVTLNRSLQSVKVDLTHKLVVKNRLTGRHVIFSGKASGGNLKIDDTFADTRDNTEGRSSYSGEVDNRAPNFGQASAVFDLDRCRYQLEVSFNVRTKFSGDDAIRPPLSASGGAYGPVKKVPASLKLNGTSSPDAFHSCTGSPFMTGDACYGFDGGWTTDFMNLKRCGSAQSVNCGPDDQKVGDALLAWHLSPSYKKPIKKPKKKVKTKKTVKKS